MSPTAATPQRFVMCVVFMISFASLLASVELVRAAGLWPVPVRPPDRFIGQTQGESLPEMRVPPNGSVKSAKLRAPENPVTSGSMRIPTSPAKKKNGHVAGGRSVPVNLLFHSAAKLISQKCSESITDTTATGGNPDDCMAQTVCQSLAGLAAI